MYAAEAVQLLSYMRHTGTASSVPYGNENWISKPSDTSILPIGRMVPTITIPTLGSINSCVLTQPRARSPAPKDERHLPGSYRLVTNDVYRARFLSAPLPIGASTSFPFFDGSRWLGKIKQPSNVLGSYVRFLDNPGPALIDLPESVYNTALHAPCGSWCLQTHGRINPLQGSYMVNNFATFVAPVAQQLPASPTSRLLSPPLPRSPWRRPTSRLLSPPLPSSPRLRSTSRRLSFPLRRSPRLWPSPRLWRLRCDAASGPGHFRSLHCPRCDAASGNNRSEDCYVYIEDCYIYTEGCYIYTEDCYVYSEDCYAYTPLPHCVVAVASKRICQ